MNHFIPIEDLEGEKSHGKTNRLRGGVNNVREKEPYKEKGSWNWGRTTVYLLL
jgi:hypothetical protein